MATTDQNEGFLDNLDVNKQLSQFTPTTPNVTEQETSTYHLNNMLQQDSPYLQQARQGAMQTANSRGLLNSSIAAGAGEQAAIQAAAPFAQFDAQAYQNRANQNQQFQNAANQYNAEADNQRYMAGYQGAVQEELGQQQFGFQTSMASQKYGFDLGILDKQLANTIAQMDEQQLNTLAQMAVQQGYDLTKLDDQQAQELLVQQKANTYQTALQNDAQAFQKEVLDMQYGDEGYQWEQMALEQTLKLQFGEVQQGWAEDLETLKATYDIENTSIESMSTLYADTIKSLAISLSNPDMTAAQQTAAVNYHMSALNSGLALFNGLAGYSAPADVTASSSTQAG
jgi:hypothetical protein